MKHHGRSTSHSVAEADPQSPAPSDAEHLNRQKNKILVIDDDPEICDYISELLSFRFQVLKAGEAEEGLRLAKNEQPVLVILDVRLHKQNGIYLCEKLRISAETKHIPILMYSGSADTEHMAQAFERGADDYIVKTATPRELVARIFSKIRRLEERSSSHEREAEESGKIACGNLILDLHRLEASVDHELLSLSILEFNLLRFFVAHKGRVMSREQILEGVWKNCVVSNRTIDTHMVHLRKKLDGFDHQLATVYGAGYILREKS